MPRQHGQFFWKFREAWNVGFPSKTFVPLWPLFIINDFNSSSSPAAYIALSLRSRAPVFIQKMSYQVPDPNSLTIPKLKSVLTQHGFGDQLPAHQEKKGFYVDLYRKHIVPLLEARNAASQSLTPGPPISTTSAASAKERTTKTDLVDRRRTIHCTPLFLLSLHVGHLGKLNGDSPN